MAWYVLLAVLGILLGIALSIRPWEKLREQREESAATKKLIRTTEQERNDLIKRQMQYDSAAGRETLARERGYKFPKEQPLETP